MIRSETFPAGLILAAALVLTACQPITDSSVDYWPAPAIGPASAAPPQNRPSTELSKYDNVFARTVAENENDGRSLLHVSYPVTEHEAISARMQQLAHDFINEFRTTAAEIETAFQEHKDKTGQESPTLVTHFHQHFDVSVANADVVYFVVTRSRYIGGLSKKTLQGFIFDRNSGQELLASDLFVDQSYLDRLSDLARAELVNRVLVNVTQVEFGSEEARNESLRLSFKWIQQGTAPTQVNFDDILFREDGFILVRFDENQVGPGVDGPLEVEIAAYELADHLRPEIWQLIPLKRPAAPSTRDQDLAFDASAALARQSPAARDDGPNCQQVLCVALTFDDGPSIYTDGLLDILKEHGVRATFFVVGQSAKIHSETIRRMDREGHQIGNHTWNHPNLTYLSPEEIREQIRLTDSIISQIIGETPQHMRPPYAAYNEYVLAATDMPVILWSVDPLDWKDRDSEIVAARIIASPAGAIILAHDIHRTTVEAVPSIIASLKSKGIHFVTVTELLGPHTLESGRIYRRQPAAPE